MGLRDGRLVAGAVAYTIRLDLLTFLRVPSPVRLDVVGLPASVGVPGVLGEPDDARALLAAALPRERGLLVGLNLDAPVAPDGAATGRTLPTLVLDDLPGTWDAYRASLRSAYRRRLDRDAARWEGVTSDRGPCAGLDDDLHRLYRDVYRRSDARLECLSAAFFRALPADFHLTVHRRDGRPLAWHVAATEGDRRTFFLGGLDYATNPAGRNYFNLLAAIVREAIGDGIRTLDLGQTAEVPKVRLGARAIEKGMFGWHRWAAVRALLRRFDALLQYARPVPVAHALRGTGNGDRHHFPREAP